MSRFGGAAVLSGAMGCALALAPPSPSAAQAPPPAAYPPYAPAQPSAYPPAGSYPAPAPSYPPGSYPAPAPSYPPGGYPAPAPSYPPGSYPAPAPSYPPGRYPPGTYPPSAPPAPAPAGRMPVSPPAWEWQPPPFEVPQKTEPPPDGETKSPVLAGWLSMASTTVPVLTGMFMMALRDTESADSADAILWAGLIVMNTGVSVGPSVGHLYVGNIGRGVGMAGVRLLGAWGSTGLMAGAGNSVDANNRAAPGVMFVAGGLVGAATVGLMIWDLIDASGAAERFNHERRLEAERRAWLPRAQLGPGAATVEWTF